MKIIIIIISLFFAASVVLYFYGKTRNQIRKTTTLDTMGQVLVALDKTLGTLDQYNPVEEAKKLFPSIASKNGQIADGWGNAITVSIKKLDNGFQVRLVSAGPDGVMNTKDDVIKEELLLEKVSGSGGLEKQP